MDPSDQRYEELKRRWTDKLVRVNAERPELKRFAGIIGRVITVNRNQKAVVDFQDDVVPAQVSLEAFNPFVPMDVEASSIPGAILNGLAAPSRSIRPKAIRPTSARV